MRRRNLLRMLAFAGSGSGWAKAFGAAPAPALFGGVADAALAAMHAKATELKVGGVAMVAAFEGETVGAWTSQMLVVGRYKDEPNVKDKGSNLLAIVYAKASEMADSHKDSGNAGRATMTGEVGWHGGVIGKGRRGYLLAAFSGGKDEDDVQVSRAGLAKLGEVL